MTYCAISFEDPKTGERWDYGEFSLFPSRDKAIREMQLNVGVMTKDHGVWTVKCDAADYIVHFTDINKNEAENFGLYIPEEE